MIAEKRKFFNELAAKNRERTGVNQEQSNDIRELGKLQNAARDKIKKGFDAF